MGRILTQNDKKQIDDLRNFFITRMVKHDLKVGDIVRWRPGYQNRRHPKSEDVALVTRLLTPEEIAELAKHREPNTPYWCEDQDIVVAVKDPDGDFAEFAVTGFRMEKVQVPSDV